jgi:hypothetical protein
VSLNSVAATNCSHFCMTLSLRTEIDGVGGAKCCVWSASTEKIFLEILCRLTRLPSIRGFPLCAHENGFPRGRLHNSFVLTNLPNSLILETSGVEELF